MLSPLHVLIVEDQETDAELIVRELKKHGYDPQWTRVDHEKAFLAELTNSYDLITVDAIMPQFNAARVLALVGEHRIETPCIIISGSIGEEEAVAMIRAGAADYLMKDRLGRLGQSIRYVLDQHRLRREHRQAHQALVTLNAELEQRIAERTAKLEEVNQQLAQELAERKQIELRLRQHEATLERRVAARTTQLERSYARLRRMASELTLAEQRERKQLASELHDYLAQLLVVAKMKIDQLSRDPASGHTAGLLRETGSALDQALSYSRTLVAQLSPTVLFTQGLVAALHWLPDYFSRHGLRVQVRSSIPSVSLPEDRAILLFQSVRELLFNVLKHAGTGEATLAVDITDGPILRITVSDNGSGFDVEKSLSTPKGFGLFSIRERLEWLGGTLAVRSSRESGTHVVLSITMPDRMGSAHREKLHNYDPNPLSPAPKGSTTWRAIVVDDHDLMRRELSDILSSIQGLTVVGNASDGLQGVALAATLSPDLVLMDINMPGLDGIEATRQILLHNPGVMVIGITINSDPETHTRMVAAGAVTCLLKTSLGEDLPTVIGNMLNKRPRN